MRLSDDEIKTMQAYLEITPSGEAHEYIERLQTLGVYIARSGVLLAEAKKQLHFKQAEFYESHAEWLSKFSPSQVKEYMKARCYDEQYYVDWLDRINATCVHQSEGLRTLISYAKMEMTIDKNF